MPLSKRFNELLQTKRLGRNVIQFESIDSTQTYLKSKLEEFSEQVIVLADYQTKGIGRKKGTKWEGGKAENLYFSMLFFSKGGYEEANRLNLGCCLAICQAVREIAGSSVMVKWPNDVHYVVKKDGKITSQKLSGMLMDNIAKTQSKEMTCVIGVGINVNEDLSNSEIDDLKEAISIRDIVKKPVERELVFASFCKHFERIMDLGLDELLKDYVACSMFQPGTKVTVYPDTQEYNYPYNAKVIGFSKFGELRVRTSNGQEKRLSTETVRIRN